MVKDGDQAAAAILAAEVSRQQLAAMGSNGPRDAPGELLGLQRWLLETWFIEQMAK